MSRRRAHADAIQALAVRQVQEQAARLRVQAERQALTAAQTRLAERNDEHQRRQTAWTAALDGALDVEAVRLWRVHAGAALTEVRDQERTVAQARDTLSDASDVWSRQMRLAEAAERIANAASRDRRRADDERRLTATEDSRLARRAPA